MTNSNFKLNRNVLLNIMYFISLNISHTHIIRIRTFANQSKKSIHVSVYDHAVKIPLLNSNQRH